MRSQIPKKLRHTALVLACAGCSMGLDGPTPSLSKISPALVCGEQLSTVLDIRGQNFAPVPTNLPGSARLVLPTFALQRSALLDGSRGSAVELVYSGAPKQAENAAQLRWLNETHMQATLDDQRVIDGRRGPLPPGVYDARVENPSGEASRAAAALTVVEPPSLAAQADLLLCESSSEPERSIEGRGFLRIADALPSVQIEGQGDVVTVSELTECQALDQSDGEAEICSRALLSVAGALAVGTYEAELVNPGTAACRSEEPLRIRVVAGPQLDSSPIESLCMRGQTRVLVVHGEGFEEVDGMLPSATLAGKVAKVVALEDCESESAAARSCKKLQLELPAGNPGAADGATTTLSIENPAPARCSASASLQLRELIQKDGSELKACAERSGL